MHPFRATLIAVASAAIAASAAQPQNPELPRTTAPEEASVYIIRPANGATLSSPVTVLFGLRGMGVGPAGLDNPKTGHHHLILSAVVTVVSGLATNVTVSFAASTLVR